MTEATLKNKKKKQQSDDNRISTHPSYTEYSWESLTTKGAQKRPVSAQNGIGQPMNSTAAVRRQAGAVQPQGNTASFGRVAAAPGKSNSADQRQSRRSTVAVPGAKTKTDVKIKAGKMEKVKTKVEYLTTDVEASRKYSFPLSLVLIALCATVLIMAIITTGVQINEITVQNSELQTQYNQLVKLENELSLLLETRDDLRIVEEMAKEELGMVKKDQVDRYYLTVHKEDKIEIIEEIEIEDSSFIDDLKSFGNSVLDRILGFFGL